jgi:hypothetical protein
MANAGKLKMKLNVRFTFGEKVKMLLCQPFVAKVVTWLPIPRRWKMRILHKQVLTLTEITLLGLNRALANAEIQRQSVDSQPTQTDISITSDVDAGVTENWEKVDGREGTHFRFRA